MSFDREPPRLIDVGHSQLAYRRFGSGPDVVFVHGWPLHSATFRGFLPVMAPRFTCHLFDLPGAGDTCVSDDTRYDLRAHADTMRRAVDAVGIGNYALVAHDSGGAIARFLAADEPARVTGVVLGNTEIPGTRSLLLRLVLGTAKTGAGRAFLTRALSSRRFRRSTLGFGSCFADRDLIDGEFHDRFVAPLLSDPALAARQMHLAESFQWEQVEHLGRVQPAITAPVQMVWGADDPYFPLDHAIRMQRELGWELEVLRPGKLFVHEERTGEFARIATDFLDRALTRGRAPGSPPRARPLAAASPPARG